MCQQVQPSPYLKMKLAVKKVLITAFVVTLVIALAALMINLASKDLSVLPNAEEVQEVDIFDDHSTTSQGSTDFPTLVDSPRLSDIYDPVRSTPNSLGSDEEELESISSESSSPRDSPLPEELFRAREFKENRKLAFEQDSGPLKNILYVFYRIGWVPKDQGLLAIFKAMTTDAAITLPFHNLYNLNAHAKKIIPIFDESLRIITVGTESALHNYYRKRPSYLIQESAILKKLQMPRENKFLIVTTFGDGNGFVIKENTIIQIGSRSFRLKAFVRERRENMSLKYSSFVLSKDELFWCKMDSKCKESKFDLAGADDDLRAHLLLFEEEEEEEVVFNEQEVAVIKAVAHFTDVEFGEVASSLRHQAYYFNPECWKEPAESLFLITCQAFRGLRNKNSFFMKMGIKPEPNWEWGTDLLTSVYWAGTTEFNCLCFPDSTAHMATISGMLSGRFSGILPLPKKFLIISFAEGFGGNVKVGANLNLHSPQDLMKFKLAGFLTGDQFYSIIKGDQKCIKLSDETEHNIADFAEMHPQVLIYT
jgi:hypothetical protein